MRDADHQYDYSSGSIQHLHTPSDLGGWRAHAQGQANAGGEDSAWPLIGAHRRLALRTATAAAHRALTVDGWWEWGSTAEGLTEKRSAGDALLRARKRFGRVAAANSRA